MANACDFEMKIIGVPDRINQFLETLQNEDTRKLYFPRTNKNIKIKDESTIIDGHVIVKGSCDWSVGEYMLGDARPTDDNATDLLKQSDLLNLRIEIFAEELGCAIEEYYLIDSGDILDEKVVNVKVYATDDYASAKEFNDIHDTSYSQKYFYENTDIIMGGLGKWEFTE